MKKFTYFFLFLITLLFQSYSHSETGQEKEKAKNVFLTGAAGFIGSNFLQSMFDKHPNYNIVVLDALTYAGSLDNIPAYIKESSRYTFIHGNVIDYPLVEKIMSKAHFVYTCCRISCDA